MEFNTFKDVFSNLADKSNYSDAEIARRLGVNRSTIGRWRTGEQYPKLSKLQEISILFDVNPLVFVGEELGGIKLDEPSNENIPDTALRVKGSSCHAPLYGSIAAGIPLEMITIEDYIEIPEYIAERFPKAFLLKVNGDSMNKIVPNGAYALIEPCEDVANGEVAAIVVNGYDATLKRFYKLQNTIVLEPDSFNLEHTSKMFDCTKNECTTMKVIGKLVWYMSPYNVKY